MYTQYLQQQGGRTRFSGPVSKLKKLSPAVYTADMDQFGEIFLDTFETYTDEIIALPGSPAEAIERDVDFFLSDQVRVSFERYNLLYKRGLLMHGLPGTGKTSIVHLLMRKALEKDMVVLLNPRPEYVYQIADNIREIEKNDRPLMVIWEEFEQWVHNNEGNLLDLLDGVDQVDNVFFLATTNYLHKIPSRIRNRPSRFAEVIEIGPPDATLRRAYLEAKVHEDDDVNMDEWVEKTEGLTIDHLKDLIISVLALNVPLDKAIEKIRIMEKEDNSLGKLADEIRLRRKLNSVTCTDDEAKVAADECMSVSGG